MTIKDSIKGILETGTKNIDSITQTVAQNLAVRQQSVQRQLRALVSEGEIQVKGNNATLLGVDSVSNSLLPPREYIDAQVMQHIQTLFATLTNTLTQNPLNDLEVPQDYIKQVEASRNIWAVFGGKFADPIVSCVMDLMVASLVAFGAENTLSDVPIDHEGKRVLDHWCATVNSDSPTLTPGLDYVREQMHTLRFLDGGVVGAWSEMADMETWDGVRYKASKFFTMLERPKFDVLGGSQFGSMKLNWKQDINDWGVTDETDPKEFTMSDKVGVLGNFLEKKNYQVLDRGRIESGRKYPIPFLVERNLTGTCARIRNMQRGDYQTILRVIRAILLITKGSDKWLENDIWNPVTENYAGMASAFTGSGNTVNVLASDYTTKAQWILPEYGNLLNQDKFEHDDLERLAGLGVLRLDQVGERTRVILNPTPMIMELLRARLQDQRFIEGKILKMIYDANPQIFKGIKPANFFIKPMTIYMDDTARQLLTKMFESGLAWGSYMEWAMGPGVDDKAEAYRRQAENEKGYDKIFEPRVQFTQTVKQDTDATPPSGEMMAEEEEGSYLSEYYSAIREKVAKVAKDPNEKDKKGKISKIIAGMFVMMGGALTKELDKYYKNQFEGEPLYTGLFNLYILKTEAYLDNFASDMDAKIASVLDTKNVEKGIEDAFDNMQSRMKLYRSEPFRVARIASEAAVAKNQGAKYALRHSLFAPNTCAECITRDGQIVEIDSLFAGEYDHPNGQCYFTYHLSEGEARSERKDMLSVGDINTIFSEISKVEGHLLRQED